MRDFAEGYTHLHRFEHQSKFFSEVYTTIFPMVLHVHLDDLQNVEKEEKTRLRELFDKHGLPHVVTEEHVVITPDSNHLAANVVHFRRFVLLPYVKENAPSVHTLSSRQDGAAGHMKNATVFLDLSKCHVLDGVRAEASFFCSCHGKCESDPAGGALKAALRREELRGTKERPTTMADSRSAYEFAQANLTQPKETLFAKNGRGVFRRFFYFVPVKGLGSVNYKVPQCDTLPGSSKLHHFRDVGKVGKLRVRERSCHSCARCLAGEWEKCTFLGVVGAPSVVTLKTTSSPAVPLTRSGLAQLGVKLAELVEENEVFAVELEDGYQEAFMLLKSVQPFTGAFKVSREFQDWCGTVSVGDVVLYGRKLEPVSADSSKYECTGKFLHAFAEDVRVRNVKLVHHKVKPTAAHMAEPCVQCATPRSNPKPGCESGGGYCEYYNGLPQDQWELRPEEKEKILRALPDKL